MSTKGDKLFESAEDRLTAAGLMTTPDPLAALEKMEIEQLKRMTALFERLLACANKRVPSKVKYPVGPSILDRLLTIDEASAMTGMSTSWLYQKAKELPFTRHVGSRLLFSAKGLADWIGRLPAK